MTRCNIGFLKAVAVLLILSGAPALAQQNANGGATTYNAPLYNAGNSPTYFTSQGTSGAQAIYNNGTNVPPIPMQQMIAGRNAPSYTFGTTTQPYTFNGANPMSGVTSIGSLSPQQASYMRAQQAQAAQAQQYNNGNATQMNMYGAPPGAGQYGANVYQPQMQEQPGMAPAQMQDQAAAQGMNAAAFNVQPQQQQPPKQRRVVYKERNNPLKTPPRLFNPDQ